MTPKKRLVYISYMLSNGNYSLKLKSSIAKVIQECALIASFILYSSPAFDIIDRSPDTIEAL